MKCPDNLHKQVTFGVVVQSSALDPLVGSKPSPIKHLTVTNPDNFWTYQWFSDIHPLPLPPPSPTTTTPSPFGHLKANKKFNIWCTSRRIFVCLEDTFESKYLTISFSYSIKYTWKKYWNNVFGHFFLGNCSVEAVLKHVWMQNHLIWLNTSNLI